MLIFARGFLFRSLDHGFVPAIISSPTSYTCKKVHAHLRIYYHRRRRYYYDYVYYCCYLNIQPTDPPPTDRPTGAWTLWGKRCKFIITNPVLLHTVLTHDLLGHGLRANLVDAHAQVTLVVLQHSPPPHPVYLNQMRRWADPQRDRLTTVLGN